MPLDRLMFYPRNSNQILTLNSLYAFGRFKVLNRMKVQVSLTSSTPNNYVSTRILEIFQERQAHLINKYIHRNSC